LGDSVVAIYFVALCRKHQIRLYIANIYQLPILRDLVVFLSKQIIPKKTTSSLPVPFSILGSWKQHSGILGAVYKQLPNLEIEDIYSYTTFQQSIIALSIQHPGSYITHHRFQLSLALYIDLSRLWYAYEEVVTANPILITYIIYIEGSGYFQVFLYPEISRKPVVVTSNYKIRVRPWELGAPLSRFEVLGESES
jgi:hypothetical protein